ncbi:imidazole glycerol phosphate synthase subunit HisF [Azospirillum sp. Marseille-Q6669]
MLRKRLIGTVLVRNGVAVQSIGFRRHLPIGRPSVAVEYLNRWGIDEIVLLDITASRDGRCIDTQLVGNAAGKAFVPLTIGGGLRTVEDIARVIQSGADKISINSAAIHRPALIGDVARMFGRQCVVVSIDVRDENGRWSVMDEGGRIDTGLDALEHARRCADLGAGEILVNTVDRDGAKRGFDLDLLRSMADAVRVPVIGLGGAGHPRHFVEALSIPPLSAVAAGNMLHFTEHSVVLIKAFLRRHGIDVRLDTYADYQDTGFTDDGRLAKRPDDYLEGLAYEHIPDEII